MLWRERFRKVTKNWCASRRLTTSLDRFAKDWRDAWNARDLPRILLHYTDDIVFRSRKAKALVGQVELHGKLALKAYWTRPLARQLNLQFRVNRVYYVHQRLVLTDADHNTVKAAETLFFNVDEFIRQASARHDNMTLS